MNILLFEIKNTVQTSYRELFAYVFPTSYSTAIVLTDIS